MKCTPHRVILRSKAVVLSFWTAQAAGIAANAAQYEREGKLPEAREFFAHARDLSPADVFTRRYCDAHSKTFRLVGGDSDSAEPVEIDLVQFIEANATGFAPEELDELRALPLGQQWRFGGGAAPAGYVERTT